MVRAPTTTAERQPYSTAAATTKTFANDVAPAATASIGTGKASASAAATSSPTTGRVSIPMPLESASPKTAAPARQTGRTTLPVPTGTSLRNAPETR